MEWWVLLIIIFAGAMALLATGLPVAFSFILVAVAGVVILQGGGAAFNTMIVSMHATAASFTLLPIPLFILMGEILWQTKIATIALDAVDKMLGRVPGRLNVLTVVSGAGFAALSGSSMANTALLGTMLLPEMDKRGYHRSMSMGPIMASGGLAMIIPPSALAVILATIGKLSIGKILIASVLPGFILAALYIGYIVIRCRMNPEMAPAYLAARVPILERVVGLIVYIAPLGIIIFLVTGVIVIGVATPTEAAALGCLGSALIAAAYGSLTWDVIKKAVTGTVYISVMMLAILVGALGFSQLLAYSGASRGLLEAVTNLPIAPILLIVAMQLIVMVLGCFMEQIAIMMITLPIFIPLVLKLGYDPIWFGVMMLINLDMALLTPPFGLLLFIMKGVAPPGTTMRQIYMAGLPFVVLDVIAIALILVFPDIVHGAVDWAYPKGGK